MNKNKIIKAIAKWPRIEKHICSSIRKLEIRYETVRSQANTAGRKVTTHQADHILYQISS